MDQFWRAAAEPRDFTRIAAVNEYGSIASAHPSCVEVTQFDSWMFPRRNERIAWSIANGLLHLHQGSGGLAVIHAYADQNSANKDDHPKVRGQPIWTIAERSVLTIPEIWPTGLQGNYNPVYGRPFSPVTTCDHRFVIFSAPYGVVVLPLCGLPGWSVDPNPQPITIVDLGSQKLPEWVLAAAPIPLETCDHEGRFEVSVGLLFARQNKPATLEAKSVSYAWLVIDLNSDLALRKRLSAEDLTTLGGLTIEGSVCQVMPVRSRQRSASMGLIFATPRGMWAAKLRYETRHQPLHVAPLPLNSTNADGTQPQPDLMLNAEVEERNFLRWQRVLYRESVASVDSEQMTVWFAERKGSREGHYKVLTFSWPGIDDSSSHSSHSTVVSVSTRPTIPVGYGQRHDIPQTFFLMDRGALHSHQVGEQSRQEHGAFLANAEDLTGMNLTDPLLISIYRCTGQSSDIRDEDMINLRSIRSLDSPSMEFGPFRLEADPLYWNQCLFICERKQERLVIFRITLSF